MRFILALLLRWTFALCSAWRSVGLCCATDLFRRESDESEARVGAPARDPDEPSSPEPRPRAGRGPPPLDLRPDDVAVPPPVDESGDPPWSDDCPPPPDDDTSQVPPDDEI